MVNVTSTTYQPMFAGLYKRTALMNERSVFQADDCPYYLYYVDEEIDFWFFSTERDSRHGYIMGREDVEVPGDVGEWRSFDNVTEQWEDDDSVTVTCLCAELDGNCFIISER